MNTSNLKTFAKYIFMAGTLIVLLAFGTFSAKGASGQTAPPPTPTPNPTDPRGEPPVSASELSISNAPGYCSSSGGSTSFESISGVDFVPNSDGTMKLTVQVFIANPTGCTSGKPCPEYDNSPEFVNAWIDWNGDKTWDASEQVMDKALTGYLNINYGGTMTAIAQFSPPTSVTTETTWLRANLGWGHDPGVCDAAWTWGNVVDQQVAVSPPKIKEIKVEGATDPKNPMTDHDVKLEAITEVPAGYEIVKVSWSGDLKPGEGNPYTYKPDKGTHGKKNIKATLTYKHTASGATGQVSKEHEFKLFFEKKGDDDGDSKPNWFEYWGTDGAVPGLTASDVGYDPTKTGYGSWSNSTDKLILGPKAAETHYPSKLNVPVKPKCPGGNFGGAKGIDSVAEVIAHERQHETFWENWNVNGTWPISTTVDSDDPTPTNKSDIKGDLQPDDYENNTTKTDPNNLDSCDLENIKSSVYKWYGDEEFVAVKAGDGQTGVADKDWANPGKQSDPAFTATLSGLSATSSGISGQSGGLIGKASLQSQQSHVFPDLAELTGIYSDLGIDNNSDGQFEFLRINVELNVIAPTTYSVVGWLQDGSGVDIAWANHTASLNAGTQQIALDFDGQLIQQHGVNGPYKLVRVEVRTGDHDDLAAFADNAHTTAAYAFSNFAPPEVTFTGSYADSGQDTGTDGFYDFLNVNVGLQVNTPGNYTLVGWLYDANGNPVPGGVANTAFSASGTHTLAFDGQSIYWHRVDGPYTVRHLEVRDVNDNRVNFVTVAHTTAVYTYNQFQHGGTTIDAASYSDQGLDVDSDGDYDYLHVELQINANQAGDYLLLASLKESGGQLITSLDKNINLSAGANAISLDFPGGPIYQHGINGPYQITSVTLLDANGTFVDHQQTAHTTQAYNYVNFSPPLISLAGNYQDYGQDTDGDGLYDYLSIDIGVVPGNTGVIIAQGQLVDSTGQEIGWVENNQQMNAGSSQIITLHFDGGLIQANGKDGPFELHNLLVYHTGDPAQATSVSQAYTTASYSHLDFEGASGGPTSGTIYLPIIMKNN